MTEADDDLSRALVEAWHPSSVPPAERALAGRLSAEMRDVVARRLRVIVQRERAVMDERPVASEVARELGLSRPRFYGMAKHYSATRSIAALGARAAERRTRPPRIDPAVREEATRAVEAALAEDPTASVASVVRRLHGLEGSRITYSMLRRIWLEARRNAPPELFGAQLLFDSVGMDATRNGHRIRLHLVIDVGTGLVLGYEVAGNDARHLGDVEAAFKAYERLPFMDLGCFAAAATGPEVLLSMENSEDRIVSMLIRLLTERGIACRADLGTVGRGALRIIGERLGPVWLGVGERNDDVSYRNGRRARMPEYTDELHRAIDVALDSHNRSRMEAVLPEPHSGRSTLDAVHSVMDALDVLVRLRLELWPEGTVAI